MFSEKRLHIILGCLSIVAGLLGIVAFWLVSVQSIETKAFKLPLGFSMSVYARDLDNPGAMTWDDKGNLLVALSNDGKVIAISDDNKDGIADKRRTVLKGLNKPERLAVKCQDPKKCSLIVASGDNLISFDYDGDSMSADNGSSLARGSDSSLFASYAVAADDDSDFCADDTLGENSLLSMFCSASSETFWPDNSDPSAVILPKNGWPSDYGYDVLVAFPGTKNLGSPTGYKVARYEFDRERNYLGQQDFITGWLSENGKVTGSPTGLLAGPANQLYVSDLYISDAAAGVIYKATYRDGR